MFKADTFDMIQNALGENIMDKAPLYKLYKLLMMPKFLEKYIEKKMI